MWRCRLYLLALACAIAAQVASGEEKFRLFEGMPELELSRPLEGYFVPSTIFKQGYELAPEKVIEQSRRMTKEELDSYITGGELKVSLEFPLFVFKNHVINVFQWVGRRDGQQQVIPRVWNGSLWMPGGYEQLQAPFSAHVFIHPKENERCYVIVLAAKRAGGAGQDPNRARQLWRVPED
jgi:hypothetical protein